MSEVPYCDGPGICTGCSRCTPDESYEHRGKVHELKCWPPFWRDVYDSTKTFEIRKNDRNYEAGDILVLNEWVRNLIGGHYTGATLRVHVVALWRGIPGVDVDYVVMQIRRCGP